MSVSRRRFCQASATGLAMAAWLPSLQAQTPTPETAKILIGFAPGGTIDLVGRRVAEKLHPGYAKAVVVENRTGAGGQIAVQAVKNAAPDGATVLLTPASPLGLHPHTFRRLPYDPVRDVVPVSAAAAFDYALAVGPQVPVSVKSVPEFLAWCRAHPASANFGSAGTGSAAHFIGASLGKTGQADLRHVAFRGSQPAITDLIGGQIAAVVGPTGEFMSNVKAGKCRLLATSGPQRGRFTPDTPTLAEQGIADLKYLGWFGFYLPAAAPADTVQRLNAGVRQALAAPDVVEGLASLYMEPFPNGPAQLATLLREESAFWARLVQQIGFTPEA
ncbi:Bug family tripartite tricarboxylate transporter substrate binding protein [Hydrogenophaga borbori]